MALCIIRDRSLRRATIRQEQVINVFVEDFCGLHGTRHGDHLYIKATEEVFCIS